MAEPFLSSHWHRVETLRPALAPQAELTRQRARGQTVYVVRDQSSGRLHRFTPEVYLCLGLMDGSRTVGEIWELVVDRLGETAPSQDEMLRLLGQLHGADLLRSDVAPDVAELLSRHDRQRSTEFRQRFSNPMSIKLPLGDPDRFVRATLPYVGWLFGRAGFVLWLALVGSALVLAAQHWAELTDGTLDNVLALENLAAIACVYPVVKLLHELGHAYTIRARGGAVHEVGLMFLILMPVPYVDASASAGFPDKYARAGVAAAGILVETALAALALYVWLLVEPGPVRAVAFNVMLIAGISTVVFNGNPLLRFDGYFVLSDLIAVPNLAGRSSGLWGHLVQRFGFGRVAASPPVAPGERVWLLAYAPAALLYRLSITFGIALMVAEQFLVVGVLLAAWSLLAAIVMPVAKLLRHVLVSPALAGHRVRAVLVTATLLGAVAAGLLVAPMPLHTVAEGVIWLPEEAYVRAGADGFLTRLAATPGTEVARGQLLVEATDPVLAAERAVAVARVRSAEAKLASEDFTDRITAGLTRRALDIERASLRRLDQRVASLEVASRTNGVFAVPVADDLPGRYVRRGEVIGTVIAPRLRLVRVVVPQADIDLVRSARIGAEAILVADTQHRWPAEMLREVPSASDTLPSRALAVEAGGSHAPNPKEQRGEEAKSLERLFQFDLLLPEAAGQTTAGGRVWVRFDHGPEPLGLQWYRRLRQLLLSRLNA